MASMIQNASGKPTQSGFAPELIEALSKDDPQRHVQILQDWLDQDPQAGVQLYSYFDQRLKGQSSRLGVMISVYAGVGAFFNITALRLGTEFYGTGSFAPLIWSLVLLESVLMLGLVYFLFWLNSRSQFDKRLISALVEVNSLQSLSALLRVSNERRVQSKRRIALKATALVEQVSARGYEGLSSVVKSQLYHETSTIFLGDDDAKLKLKIACLRLFERGSDIGAIPTLKTLISNLKFYRHVRPSSEMSELDQTARGVLSVLERFSKLTHPENRLLRAADPNQAHEDLLRAPHAHPETEERRLLRVNTGHKDENNPAD